jgi:hypothetical protein
MMRPRFEKAVVTFSLAIVCCVMAAAQSRAHQVEHSNARFNARDLSGVWMQESAGANTSFSSQAPPPMTAWAEARFRQNKPTMGANAALDANDPTVECFPPGVPYVLTIPTPFEIVQAPGRVIESFEYNHTVRRIFTDGRQHPGDLQATEIFQWMGHSIGTWQGDTLVIDTIGFNDKTWLDRSGRPHSDALHVTERMRRIEADTLQDDIFIEDAKAYTAPWAGQLRFKRKRGWDILEHICVAPGSQNEEYRLFRERASERASDIK